MENVIRAFGAEHVQHLVGLSAGQLRRWDNEGFFTPTYAYENRRSPYSRIYSFKDVVGLRVLKLLRDEYRISMQHLRKVAVELRKWNKTSWADLTLYVFNRQVYFREPETGKIRGIINKQFAADLPLNSVIDDMRLKSEDLRKRRANQIGSVERHRFVAHNSWVVAGTRIPLGAVKRFSDAGFSIKQIIAEYPDLTEHDVKAALNHLSALTRAA